MINADESRQVNTPSRRRITLLEFDLLIKEKGYRKYIFSKEDTPCLVISAEFDTVSTMFSPNMITFFNDEGGTQITIEFVRFIYYIGENNSCWDKFEIACKRYDGENLEVFTVLADY